MLVRAALAVSTLIVLLAGCVSVPQRPSDLTELGVADAAALIRAKQVTSVELTQAYLARAEANRSEEHTSELQSRFDLVCRLLLEKKKARTRVDLIRVPKAPRRRVG